MTFNENRRDAVSRLIFELSKLPGIGEKTATRLAYHIIRQSKTYAEALSNAVVDAKEKITLCKECFTLTDTSQNPCHICSNEKREASSICVVEQPSDIHAIEKTMTHRGKYHVLHGVLSPLDGIGPEELKIKELLLKLKKYNDRETVTEIIIATNPSIEGEATALYLSKLLKPLGMKVTQLAHGLPMGGMLEYTDRQTIGKAIENRVEIS